MKTLERWIERHPVCCLVLLGIGIIAGGQITDGPEIDALAFAQHRDSQAWEQGYRQGREAGLNTRQEP
jgi:hypothetical protein